MRWSRSRWALLTLIALAATVGAIDAAIGRSWDLVVLQAAVVALSTALALGAGTGRAPLTLRRDLARWLVRVAAEGGERPEDVVDRAVAAYRAGLTATHSPDDDSGTGDRR